MNPHTAPSCSLLWLVKSMWTNRALTYQMIKREVVGRYQGSAMGLLWSFFNPLLMLAVYTFVFSEVFKARWAGGTDSKTEFALVLFAGLMIFNLFSECINKAPSLILSNVNYVKKVIFPLEILPVVALGSAAFHFLISLGVWLVFYFIFFGLPPVTIFQLPLITLPMLVLTLGFSWFLASLGVFLRDITQIIAVITSVLLFLSPVFYPLSALPLEYQNALHFSPLTLLIEQTRDAMLWGKMIDWVAWSIMSGVSILIAWLGFAWFQKTRKGFADVL